MATSAAFLIDSIGIVAHWRATIKTVRHTAKLIGSVSAAGGSRFTRNPYAIDVVTLTQLFYLIILVLITTFP
jgi:hypothetical protein